MPKIKIAATVSCMTEKIHFIKVHMPLHVETLAHHVKENAYPGTRIDMFRENPNKAEEAARTVITEAIYIRSAEVKIHSVEFRHIDPTTNTDPIARFDIILYGTEKEFAKFFRKEKLSECITK